MPSISTITVAEPRYAPGQFVLIRSDLPNIDQHFLWCGRSMGWQPNNKTTRLYHVLYRDMEQAEEDAQRYVSWPLPQGV